MKTQVTFILPAVLASAVALCAAVRTDYDHKADFGHYRTYSWIGVRAGDSLWQDRITSAVDSALAAKGWTKVPSGGEATVSAFGRTREQDTLQTFYDGFPGWGWDAGWWGGGMDMGESTTQVVPERVGNLTVDIFDANTKKLIWRGVASDAVGDNPEKNEKKMDKTVDDMFKKFPPNGKG
ncbi:MAG: DUF4136 domain-containing protein [Candidatus Sulfopaludibacter sp.]|nr:DUF4136 domain-containing protein [Candidatus Sulfopaludibacter sp.]